MSLSFISDVDAVSLRGKKHELYRQIRSHIWKAHGRAQIHGWSIPAALKNRVSGNCSAVTLGSYIHLGLYNTPRF